LGELEAAAAAQKPAEAVAAGARVHRLFVRLHPFVAGNQSLAFGIVNAALRRARGAGIPHLVLDHLALAGSDALHLEAFRAAVDAWGAPGESPAARTLRLARLRAAVFTLLGEVDRAGSPDEARARVLERPEISRAALLA
ncbi:MAG: hypothetical protein FJ104_11330, partial [Deltaproteobacteria bacterium]|nr:hypothetical protein [Deltaproteobacteria bacterium]